MNIFLLGYFTIKTSIFSLRWSNGKKNIYTKSLNYSIKLQAYTKLRMKSVQVLFCVAVCIGLVELISIAFFINLSYWEGF